MANSEQRLTSFVELSSDRYWERDKYLRFKRFSDDLVEIVGTTDDTHYGISGCNLSIPDNEANNWSNHQALLERYESFNDYEHRRIDENGDVVWLIASGEPIFDFDSQFTGYRGISRDFTKQKNAEIALKESEERLRLSVNISGIGIWEWDMISDHVIWDKKQFQLFERPEVEGTISLSSITAAIHPDDREQLNRTALRVFEEGASAAEEFRIVLPDGSVRWLLGASGVVHFNDSVTTARLVGVNMDITASKHAEADLRESQLSLQIANATLEKRIVERTAELEAEAERHIATQSNLALSRRLESIGELAGGVAHDFNNLLAVIGGNLELALPHVTHTESRKFLSKSLIAVNSGISLNQRLLVYARKKYLKPVKLSVSEQLQDIVSLLERTLGENILITTKVEPGTWDAYIDSGEFHSSLVNLSINARDAMPGGGQLTIETRNIVIGDECNLMYPSSKPGDYVALFVTDTGIGMSEDVQQKSIDPFFTTKESGTGLGLSSVYGFAQQSGGFLSIESRLGIGTTISIFLPRAPESQNLITADETPKILASSSGQDLILIVEDDSMVRELVVERLKNIGYQILEASTGQEAVDILEEYPAVRLVFSDIVMPGEMTGYELAQWVVTHRPEVKILMTSGYFDPDSNGTAQMVDKSIAVLEKPYPLETLAKSIRSALDA